MFRSSRRRAVPVSVPIITAWSLCAALLWGLVPAAGAGAPAGESAVVAATAVQGAKVQGAKKTSPAVRYRKQAQRATNRARQRNDMRKFRADTCLATWARKHAKRLARDGAGIWHQALQPIMEDCNLRSVGENVALGYPTGRAVVNRGWLRSPGHRANILNRRFRLSVVVARRDGDGRWYAVQLFGSR